MIDKKNLEKPRLLMVVFEFPPSNGASIQRMISVYRGFLAAGWDVDVLTAKEHAYPNVKALPEDFLPENPDGQVVRTLALDVMRHLAVGGKHIGSMIKPDRWGMTWIPSATLAGNRLVDKRKPDVIWSSAPTPSPHVIAKRLAKRCGAKWIADYRDPMPYLHRPTNSALDVVHRKIDAEVKAGADLFTFATSKIRDTYLTEFQASSLSAFEVMENGFDRSLMKKTKAHLDLEAPSVFNKDKFSFYYAGVLYDNGRDPIPVFEALAYYKENNSVEFEMVFQGAGDGSAFTEVLKALGLEDNVRFIDGVGFSEALKNILLADALVLVQDEKFNQQVPGKIYEYLASGKAILLKTPEGSATYDVAEGHGGIFSGYKKHSIYQSVCDIIRTHCDDDGNRINRAGLFSFERNVDKHSREHHVEKLIQWASHLKDTQGTGGKEDFLQGAQYDVTT